MATIIEETSTITAKGQTTVPKAVRQVLGVDYGGKIVYRVENGRVTVHNPEAEHRDPVCRRLHFVGSTLVIAVIVAAILTRNAWWLAAAPFAGYGFAWVGHFFFEGNSPATFSHPLYSLRGDLSMLAEVLTGRMRW